MKETLEYYKNNTQQFFDETIIADTTPLHERFLSFVPDGGAVLDFGCGSGRDTKVFKDMGYDVSAVDGSPELVKLAKEYSGVDVKCADFFDYASEFADDEAKSLAGADVKRFDGIFACASMLHVKRDRVPELINKMRAALKPGGVFYMSFKYGEFDGLRDGRYFLDLNEEGFAEIFKQIEGYEIADEWYSEDVRRGKDVRWLNVILRRVE